MVFVPLKLLDISAKIISRQPANSELDSRGLIQTDNIIVQINHTAQFITLLLLYTITPFFFLQIARIGLPNTAMKCNLSSLERD